MIFNNFNIVAVFAIAITVSVVAVFDVPVLFLKIAGTPELVSRSPFSSSGGVRVSGRVGICVVCWFVLSVISRKYGMSAVLLSVC